MRGLSTVEIKYRVRLWWHEDDYLALLIVVIDFDFVNEFWIMVMMIEEY